MALASPCPVVRMMTSFIEYAADVTRTLRSTRSGTLRAPAPKSASHRAAKVFRS